MLISCTICRDLLLPHDTPLVTSCGHVYHDGCIMRWAERQKNCPQCRTPMAYQPIRIFFNIEHNSEEDTDVSLLREKIDQSNIKLQESAEKLKEVEKRFAPVQLENTGLRVRVETLETQILEKENQILEKDGAFRTMKLKLISLMEERRHAKDTQKKLEKAQHELNLLASMKNVIEGTADDVAKSLKTMPCTEQSLKQMSTYVEVLKQQLEKKSHRLKTLMLNQKPLNETCEKLKRSQTELTAQLEEAMRTIDQLKSETCAVPEPEALNTTITLDEDTLSNVTNVLQPNVSYRVINNLATKRLDNAVSKPRPHLLPMKRCALSLGPSSSRVSYDGMGGSKRPAVLPTPRDEINDVLRRRAQTKSRAENRAPSSRPNLATVVEINPPQSPQFIDLD